MLVYIINLNEVMMNFILVKKICLKLDTKNILLKLKLNKIIPNSNVTRHV